MLVRQKNEIIKEKLDISLRVPGMLLRDKI